MVGFFDREEELRLLQQIYRMPTSSMVVVYGRRRVGKTELVKEFFRNKKNLYIFIEVKPEELLLRDLEDELARILKMTPRLDTWDDFFELIFKVEDKLVIVFDEFQNFARINPNFFSKFQKYWDLHSGKSRHMFIIVGSYVGMIKRIFQQGKEPLFGRATLHYNLRPFSFFQTYEFLRALLGVNIEEAVRVYSLFGGVPKYLLLAYQFGSASASEALKKLFTETRILVEEGKNILVLEFGSEHKSYFSILEAVAMGKSTPKEISDYTKLPRSAVSKYLHELLYDYEIIKKETPIIKAKARDTRYFIRDNFFSFWFRFVYRNMRVFEIDGKHAEEIINRDINAFFGRVFEDVAREFLIELNRRGELPFKFSGIGRWWHHEEEIDMIALNKRDALLCEVKWEELEYGEAKRILEELKEKSAAIKREKIYCLVAKKIEHKSKLDCLAYDLRDLERIAI